MTPARARVTSCMGYVLFVHAVRLIAASVAAYPASAIATKSVGSWPGGDAVLFEPGSLLLVEVYRLHRVAIDAWLTQSALFLGLMIPIGIGLNAILLAALSHEGPKSPTEVVTRAAGTWRALAITWVVFGAATVGVAGAFFAASQAARDYVARIARAPVADATLVGVLALAAIIAMAMGIAHDVVRAAIVRGRLDVAGAFLAAQRCARAHGWELIAAWWARAAAALLIVLVELWMTRSIPWLTSSGAAMSFVVHQLVLLSLLLLRVSWLGRAVDLVAAYADEERRSIDILAGETVRAEGPDTAARTDAQADPS